MRSIERRLPERCRGAGAARVYVGSCGVDGQQGREQQNCGEGRETVASEYDPDLLNAVSPASRAVGLCCELLQGSGESFGHGLVQGGTAVGQADTKVRYSEAISRWLSERYQVGNREY